MNYNINDLNKYKIITERITAYLIDFLILTPILAISIVMFATTSSVIIINTWSFASFFLIFSFFTFFIFLYGQTPGKMLMNIVTLSGDGKLPSLQQSILRSAAYFITSIPLLKMADIMFIVLNSKRRSIRDFSADTIVVACDNKISKKSSIKILLIIISALIIDIILLQAVNLIEIYLDN